MISIIYFLNFILLRLILVVDEKQARNCVFLPVPVLSIPCRAKFVDKLNLRKKMFRSFFSRSLKKIHLKILASELFQKHLSLFLLLQGM